MNPSMFMKKRIYGVLIIVVLIAAYFLISPLWKVKTMDEELPGRASGDALFLAEADMMPSAHEVSGWASFVKSGDDVFLRFDDLETVNGPDLRIYLSTDLGVNDAIDLGPIKATKGNVNYKLEQGVNISKYNQVLIWCRAFSVLFSYADLSNQG